MSDADRHDTPPFPGTVRRFGIARSDIAGPSLLESQDVLQFILQSIPEDGRVLEIGAWACSTTAWLADRRPGAMFVAVDCYPSDASGMRRLLLSLVNCDLRRNIKLFWGRSNEFARLAKAGQFDLVIVDADHAQEAVSRDLEIAARLAKPAGVIMAHDYDAPYHPGVRPAVDAFCGSGLWGIVDRCASMVAMRIA